MRVKCEHRLLLTGTPLQNNLGELWSLLYFLMPNVFGSIGHFDELSKDLEKRKKKDKEIISTMKTILSPFILRRLKSMVLDQIAPKEEFVRKIPIADLLQKKTYMKAVKMSKKFCKEDISEDASDEDKENTVNLSNRNKKETPSNILMELRKVILHLFLVFSRQNTQFFLTFQISNHPLMVRTLFSNEKLLEIAAKLKPICTDYKKRTVEEVAEELSFMSDFDIHCICSRFNQLESYMLSKGEHFLFFFFESIISLFF